MWEARFGPTRAFHLAHHCRGNTMRRIAMLTFGALALALGWLELSEPSAGQVPASPFNAPEKRYEDFDKLVKGAKVYEGLFHLHQKDEHLYAEIQRHQFNQPLLCPIAIARGMGMGGYTLNFDEQWVLMFKQVGD